MCVYRQLGYSKNIKLAKVGLLKRIWICKNRICSAHVTFVFYESLLRCKREIIQSENESKTNPDLIKKPTFPSFLFTLRRISFEKHFPSPFLKNFPSDFPRIFRLEWLSMSMEANCIFLAKHENECRINLIWGRK